MPTDKRTVKWYNVHAAEYTQHVRDPNESVYHSLYEKPAMYSLLPDLKGKSVLSIGCGSGEDCHYLAGCGVSKVAGIDISTNLVDIARQSYPECQFDVMDMESLAFDDDSFDFVYSSLAIHYLEDWTKAFCEVYRVLKPGSLFLFSCGHPVYSAMATTQDDNTNKVQQLARIVDTQTDKTSIVGDYVTRHYMDFNDWIC